MLSCFRFAPVLAAATILLGSSVQAAPADYNLFGNAVTGEGEKKNETAVVLISDVEAAEPFAGIAFEPRIKGKAEVLTFADLQELSVTYRILEGGFGAGSLRFSVGIDQDADGSADGNIFVYVGESPNFDDEPGDWTASGNLLASGDLRIDTSQVGGTFYDTLENAIALTEGDAVVQVVLVADSGYFFESGVQAIAIQEAQVGDSRFKSKLIGKGKN